MNKFNKFIPFKEVKKDMNEQTYLVQKNEQMGENSLMKKLFKKRLNQKGLTLIELLAVIVILAIIAAIAIPAISNLITSSRDKAVLADAQTIIAGAKLASAAGECPEDLCETDTLETYVDGEDIVDGAEVVPSTWSLNTWGGWDRLSEDSDFAPADTDAVLESEILTLLGN